MCSRKFGKSSGRTTSRERPKVIRRVASQQKEPRATAMTLGMSISDGGGRAVSKASLGG